jgi:cyclophilin family peptidyl-prolyl cis-trans isomerase
MRCLLIALIALIAVGVAGCGGGGDKFGQATTSSTRTETHTVTVQAPTSTTAGGCRPVSQAPTSHPERTREASAAGRLDPSKKWTVFLDTNCGLISIDLDVNDSPKTATAFAGLVNRGFFSGLTFHRIANQPDGTPFVIQGGDPLGDGLGGPGYRVTEQPPPHTDYTRGVVAMAKSATEPAGTSGSQFFIVTGRDAGLPPDYALLGHVSAGMKVVDRIAAQPTQGNEMPVSPVVIRSATVSAH